MRGYGIGVALRTAGVLALVGFILSGDKAWPHGGSHGPSQSASSTASDKLSNHNDWVPDKETTQRPMQPLHGGQITATRSHYFEVVYTPTEIRIYPYLTSQRPMNARGITGSALLYVKSSSQSRRCPVQCVARPSWTGDLGYLAAAVELSQVHDGDMEVTFDFKRMATREESHVSFTQVFALTQPPLDVAAVPLAAADRPEVFRQRVCPVTDTPLGEHGEPIKLVVAEQPLYVCCDDCVQRVRNDPRTYLGKAAASVPQIAPRAVPPPIMVTYAAADDRPARQAQAKCAVTGQPLREVKDPIKVQLDGRPLFVCCWDCVRDVGQNQDSYQGKAESQIGIPQRPLQPRVVVAPLTPADEIAIGTQGRCPVTDQPLGSHGPPIKLLLEGRPIFVCCQGCARRVEQAPDHYAAMSGARQIAPISKPGPAPPAACASCSPGRTARGAQCSGPNCGSRFSP